MVDMKVGGKFQSWTISIELGTVSGHIHKATYPLELNFRFFSRFLKSSNRPYFLFFAYEAFLNSNQIRFEIFKYDFHRNIIRSVDQSES